MIDWVVGFCGGSGCLLSVVHRRCSAVLREAGRQAYDMIPPDTKVCLCLCCCCCCWLLVVGCGGGCGMNNLGGNPEGKEEGIAWRIYLARDWFHTP